MGLEEKLLEAPRFTDVVRLARWYVKNKDNLVQDWLRQKTPSVVRVAAELGKLGKIPKRKQDYFRRQMNSVDYILNTKIQDETGESVNLMRSEIERILDSTDIESCFVKGHFSYDLFRRNIRENINREEFKRRDTGKQVSDGYLDQCVFFASELWGEEYVLKYLLEKYNYSKSMVSKKLKMSPAQISTRLSKHGIKLDELKQNRYKVMQEGNIFYILLRKEKEMSKVYFTTKYLTENVLGVRRQRIWEYLHKRAKIPKDPWVRFSIRMSVGVYRDIIDSYVDSVFRFFSVSRTGEYNYEIRNFNESGSSPAVRQGVELRRALQVSNSSFADITTNRLKITPHPRNRYSFSNSAFLSIVTAYGPK